MSVIGDDTKPVPLAKDTPLYAACPRVHDIRLRYEWTESNGLWLSDGHAGIFLCPHAQMALYELIAPGIEAAKKDPWQGICKRSEVKTP